MISAIIGIILLVGGITLYRTFALYEEKKEFNVLRGKVPNFEIGNMDIKLAFTINGEEQSGASFPNKEDGYGVESVLCKNGITAEWNSSFWGLVNIKNTTNEKIECNINFVDTVTLDGNGSRSCAYNIRPIVILKSDITGVKSTMNDKNLWTIN